LMPDLDSLLANTRSVLLAELVDGSHWEGELSSSALSTATAIIALRSVEGPGHARLVEAGVGWLEKTQNADGGWGDTRASFSNISTSLLCRAALAQAGGAEEPAARAEKYISSYCGSSSPQDIVDAVIARYGKDRTFSVPILMACAIAGLLGGSPGENWRRVLPLPFELGAFPRQWFGALRLPVVSYALPALIAIGYARFVNAPPGFPFRQYRRALWPRVSALLEQIQPPNGGFLEATPLTSFVTMALASAGQSNHPVVTRAVAFLRASVREDGSWPIDTNLATWATTLAVKSLEGELDAVRQVNIRRWLLAQQYHERHLYTDAPPGGWAWTDLPGGVPDADDTPGALLALRLLADEDSMPESLAAAEKGIRWLLDIQNRDGGIPTFCKGWGKLPFDRSSPDLTAHTLRAWQAWLPQLPLDLKRRVGRQSGRALRYLRRMQQPDGSWLPLWFGNQHRADEANPTYGTTQILRALLPMGVTAADVASGGVEWLLENRNPDGGWGGGGNSPSSIEETALALDALADAPGVADEVFCDALSWLAERTAGGTRFPPAPIGFYFAKLWYHEKLYPVVWTASALARVKARRNRRASEAGSASF
jgi:squalene-hopene/tetraprenyl-beta-curcumene cyclase